MPVVEALRSFRGVEGYVRRGDFIEVTPARHTELAAHGLVTKAALQGKNKMAPPPENKRVEVGGISITVAPQLLQERSFPVEEVARAFKAAEPADPATVRGRARRGPK